MATWYLSKAQYNLVTQWAATTAYNVGDLRRQLAAPTYGNERVFRCTTAGTSGGTEPTWTLTKGSTTNDGTAVWTEVTGNSTYAWSAAMATLDNFISWSAAGDTGYVGDDHNDTPTVAAGKTYAFPGTVASPTLLYCVDHTITTPTTSDFKTGAVMGCTGNGNFSLTLSNTVYCYGVTWSVGAGFGGLLNLNMGGTGYHQIFEQCVFYVASNRVGGGNSILMNNTIHYNCTYRYGSNSDTIGAQNAYSYGCTLDATDTGGTYSPASSGWLLYSNNTFQWWAEDCDFSALNANSIAVNNTNFGQHIATFKRCKFGSSLAFGIAFTGSFVQNRIDFIQCDSGSTYSRTERWHGNGNQVSSTVVARASGMQDSGVAVSHRFLTLASTRWWLPFFGIPIAIWNTTTGSSVNVTLEMIADPRDFSAIPNKDDVWFDVEYLGTSGNILGVTAKGTKTNALATGAAHTSSTADWTAGSAASRANSTAYSLGNIIKLASNPGRLFVCTTAGTSAGSEPAGYASAVDGGSVTDGTATFKAMWRFKQTIAVTPQAAGLIYAIPKVGKTSVTSGIYVDPLITLS